MGRVRGMTDAGAGERNRTTHRARKAGRRVDMCDLRPRQAVLVCEKPGRRVAECDLHRVAFAKNPVVAIAKNPVVAFAKNPVVALQCVTFANPRVGLRNPVVALQ